MLQLLFVIFTADSYRMEFLGEAGLRWSSSSQPYQAPTSYGGFDRLQPTKYSITGWFAFEQLGADTYDAGGMMRTSNSKWIPCVTIATNSKATVQYNTETLELDFTLQELEWYFISAWVNLVDATFGIWIGAFDSQISTQCTQKNYGGGSMLPIDRTDDFVYLGKPLPSSTNMIGLTYDSFLETSPIDSASKLDTLKSSYSCHSYCTSGSCHGPSNFDCDEFIQVTNSFSSEYVPGFTKWDSDEPPFDRNDYGLDSTWVGWIKEISINNTGTKSYILTINTENCATCTLSRIYWSNTNTGNYLENTLCITQALVDNGQFLNPTILYGQNANEDRINQQVFIGVSFESSTNSMTLCWALPGDQSATWETITNATWTQWPASGMDQNNMKFGSTGINPIDAEYRSSRYYHKSSHGGSDLSDLFLNLENPYTTNCITWDDNECTQCGNGYYLDPFNDEIAERANDIGLDITPFWDATSNSYIFPDSGLDPDWDIDSWMYPYYDNVDSSYQYPSYDILKDQYVYNGSNVDVVMDTDSQSFVYPYWEADSASFVNPYWDADSSSHVYPYWDEDGDAYIYPEWDSSSSEYEYPGSDVDPASIAGPIYASSFYPFLTTLSPVCFPCHAKWATCSGPSDIDCITCATDDAGNQLLLLDGWCTSACPTGTTLSGTSCTYANVGKIVEFDFSTIAQGQILTDTINSIPALMGQTTSSENSDPEWANQRGLYFDGWRHLLTIDYDSSKVLSLPTKWSIFWWGRYKYDGFILGRYDDNDVCLFRVYINEDYDFEAQITSAETTLTIQSTPWILGGDKWFSVGFSCVYDNVTKATTCMIIQDTVEVSAQFTTSETAIIVDNPNNRLWVGGGNYNSPISELAPMFIYDILIFNDWNPSTIGALVYGDSNQCSGCSLCPANTLTCLSLWEDDEDVLSNGICGTCSNIVGGVCCADYAQDGACVTSCASTGYYTNVSSKECQACPSNCDACSSSAASCTTCSAGYYVKSNTCDPCPADCDACSSVSVCTTCASSFVLRDDDSCHTTCPAAYFDNGSGVCEACSSDCDACTDASTCTTCAQNYVMRDDNTCHTTCQSEWFDNGSGVCAACPALCDTCTSAQVCTACLFINVLRDDDQCHATCLTGYFADVNRVCTACPQNCDQCSSTTTCTACTSSFVLRDDDLCHTTCQAAYFDNGSGVCEACSSNCDACTDASTCTTCAQNHVLRNNDSTCNTTCQNRAFDDGSGVCQWCPSLCYVCQSLSACDTCSQHYVKRDDHMCYSDCPPSWFDNGNRECEACPSNCDTCSDSQNCTACTAPYVRRFDNTCHTTCEAGRYDDGSRVCQAWVYDCDVCSDAVACTACSSVKVLRDDNQCHDTCETGWFDDGSSGSRVCVACPANCDQCSSAQTCTACTSPFVLRDDNLCHTDCQIGFFDDGSKVCQSCLSGCDVCSSTQACTTCASTHVLRVDNACYTTCETGYFNNGNGACDACAQNWDACTSASTCTACASTHVLRFDAVCYTSCESPGWFEDVSSGSRVCGECTSECDVCSSSFACTTCTSPSVLRDDGQCYNTCETGYFNNGSACSACSANCDVCSSASICTTCASAYVLRDDAACYTSCDVGQYNDGTGVCVACEANCDACSSDAVCTACTSPYVLRNDNDCHDSCQDGWFDDGSRVCVACHGTCATCTAAKYDQCLTCATGLSKIDSDETTPSACDCSTRQNASKEAKLACLNDSNITNQEAGSVPIEAVLDEISNILVGEELSVEEFDAVFQTISNAPIVSAEEEQKALEIMVVGGLSAIKNSDEATLSIVSEKFEAQFQKESQDKLQGAAVTTPTGSGVKIPMDLVGQNVVAPDANLIVNVVHMKASNSTGGLNDSQDVISVSINELLDDGGDKAVVFQNLTTNFTIVLANQSYNATETFECVYLKANEWNNGTEWSTDGCFLNSLDSGSSECSCNHLTEFSMRKATEGAQAPNNAAATTDFSSAANYSLDTNQTPLIVILCIQAVWWPIFILLRRSDMKKHPEEDVSDRVRKAFARAFGLITRRPTATHSLDRDIQSPNCSSDAINAQNQSASETMENKVTTLRPNVIANENCFDHVTFRNEENEPGLDVTKDPTKQVDEPVKTPASQISLKHRFFQRFKLIGVFINGGDTLLRSELWAIFLTIVMVSIFVTGLFYQDDTAEGEEEEDKTFWETIQAFTWQDFWIILYSVSITVPIPVLLKFFFTRKELDHTKDLASQLRIRKYKRWIGFTMVFTTVLWCSWSCIAFSLAFGYNATQRWMLTFGLSEAFDLSVKDPLVALTLIMARIMYGYIRDRHSKVDIMEPTTADQIKIGAIDADDSIAGSMISSAPSTVAHVAMVGPGAVKLQDQIHKEFKSMFVKEY